MRITFLAGTVLYPPVHVPNGINREQSFTEFHLHTVPLQIWDSHQPKFMPRPFTHHCKIYGPLSESMAQQIEKGDIISLYGEENPVFAGKKMQVWVTVKGIGVLVKSHDLISRIAPASCELAGALKD